MFSNTSNSFISNQMRPRRRNHFITVVILGCIIFIFLFAYAAYGRDTSDSSLIQINVLFRHGERTPNYMYPNDPHKDYAWPGGLGELTNAGKLRMYNFGKGFRGRYGQFLGELYHTTDVQVRSSYSPRCQMSAMTLLAGLYPPVGSQVWSSDLRWQPILVNPIPRNEDNMIAAKAPCRAYDAEKTKADDSIQSNLTQAEKDLFIYLSEHTGTFINNIEPVEFLYNTLKIEEDAGLQLPDWTISIYPEPMRRLAALNLASYTWTPTLKRLKGGPLVREWIESMKKVERKAYFYSGHDLTLVNAMRTLGLASPDLLPSYGATLVLELHFRNNEKIVQVLYYDSNRRDEPVTLKLPGCESDHCLLETVENQLRPYIPQDWATECNLSV